MTQDEIFDIWAPPDAPWSAWAKPVLFADLWTLGVPSISPADIPWAPPADGSAGIVVDLPAALTFAPVAGLLARGFRPVPLYNAVRGPPVPNVACDVGPILSGLAALTPVLASAPLSAVAPPMFLLDAHRRAGRGLTLGPGAFDNRSVSLPTDFPSANVLLPRGIRRIVLVQDTGFSPQPDLAHTLLRWQDAGVVIEAVALGDLGGPQGITIAKPSLFRAVWHRFYATFGLRPNPLGGYGGILPIPGSGG